jgi:hypothetical protein
MTASVSGSPPILNEPDAIAYALTAARLRRKRLWCSVVLFFTSCALINSQVHNRGPNSILIILALWMGFYVFICARKIHAAKTLERSGLSRLFFYANLRTFSYSILWMLVLALDAGVLSSPGDTTALPIGLSYGIVFCFLPFILTLPTTFRFIRQARSGYSQMSGPMRPAVKFILIIIGILAFVTLPAGSGIDGVRSLFAGTVSLDSAVREQTLILAGDFAKVVGITNIEKGLYLSSARISLVRLETAGFWRSPFRLQGMNPVGFYDGLNQWPAICRVGIVAALIVGVCLIRMRKSKHYIEPQFK